MSKAVYVGLAALALWGAGANGHAASPVVAGDYDLWNAAGLMFLTEVITSPNGVAIFRWSTFDGGVFYGAVAVMKNADEPYVTYSVITAALNEDWSKIAIGRKLEVFDPLEADTVFVDDVEKVAREIGVQPAEVIAALYDDGFVGISLVSQPVIVDLGTRVETPLAVAGGDFLYWLNDDELVIGRLTSGVYCGFMEAIKYDVRTGERETFAFEDLAPLFSERCTEWAKGLPRPYNLRRPYTSKDWRHLEGMFLYKWEEPAPPVAVPSRGGQFQNDEGAIYWVPAAGGPKAKVAAGISLAASDDGVWLLVMRFDHTYDPPWREGLYGLRLAWQ